MARSFVFDAHGIGLTGNLQHPQRVWIPSLAPMVLSPFGGAVHALAETYRLGDVLRLERAECRIRGEFVAAAGVAHTALEIEINGLNLLNVVAVERMGARLFVAQKERSAPSVNIADVVIQGLRIAGIPLRVVIEPDWYPKTRPRARSLPQSLGWNFGPWHAFAEQTETVSLIKSIELEEPKSADPRVQLHNNEVAIHGFGRIWLGELGITVDRRQITMLRIAFEHGEGDNTAVGGVVACSGSIGGTWKTAQSRAFPAAKPVRTEKELAEDRELASGLAAKLLEVSRETSVRYSEEELHIYLPDVQQSVERFRSQIQLLREVGGAFPCLWATGMDRPVPIALGLDGDLIRPSARDVRQLFRQYLEVALRERLRSAMPQAKVIGVDFQEAIELFRSGLEQFLQVRFSARQSDVSEQPPFPVTVTTKTDGLRIYVSNVFSFEDDRFFGFPTSPKTSYLRPGLYWFGAAEDRIGARPVFDPTKWSIPNQRDEVYLPI